MKAWDQILNRVRPLMERVDHLALRERGLVFGAGVVLIYIAWQTLLMDPLAARAHASELRLTEARHRLDAARLAGAAAARDPSIAAAVRNTALAQRLATLDGELAAAAQGYVSPERAVELLRELLADQHGLQLVSLRNLPVESLSRPAHASPVSPAAGAAATDPAADGSPDPGPFVHPIELIVEGDYLSVVAYLQALEKLPWRVSWRRLELQSGEYPRNRVRIVIGAFSLSKDWMSV